MFSSLQYQNNTLLVQDKVSPRDCLLLQQQALEFPAVYRRLYQQFRLRTPGPSKGPVVDGMVESEYRKAAEP